MNQPDPLYRHNQFTVHRIDGRLTIWEGAYRLEGYAPATLAVAKSLIDELCRCTVCGGKKIVTCRVCHGDKRIYKYVTHPGTAYRNAPSSIACPACLGRGYTLCPRCGGSGEEPC